jgi:small subunit ribosomal protein S16
VAVKIRLKRMGKIRAPYYRIVVADARTKRDGRVIEEIGKYHPKEDPSFIEVDSERAQYWLGVGAQPSEPVTAILKVTGDWQRFRGEAAPAPMKVAEPRRDKADLFNEALKDSHGDPSAEAVTARRSTAKKTASAPANDDTAPAAAAAAVAAPGAPAEADVVAEATPAVDEAAASAADQAPVDQASVAAVAAPGTPSDTIAAADEEAPVAETSPVTGDSAAVEAVTEDAPVSADETVEPPAGDTGA